MARLVHDGHDAIQKAASAHRAGPELPRNGYTDDDLAACHDDYEYYNDDGDGDDVADIDADDDDDVDVDDGNDGDDGDDDVLLVNAVQ